MIIKLLQPFIEEKARQVFGETFYLKQITRVLGGAQKHTYLVESQHRFNFIMYIWDQSTSYFSADEQTKVFTSSSAELFELNNRMMHKHEVLTPTLYFMDRSRNEQKFEYAFVEYIDGSDMDTIIESQPERLTKVMASLKRSIDNLHKIEGDHVGQLHQFQPLEFQVIGHAYHCAMKNITFLNGMKNENGEFYLKLSEYLFQLSNNCPKRKVYTFIHGELGPNHVMVDKEDHAYLIDIEGAKYCDLEEELSFLKIRFGDATKYLMQDINSDRMEFYHICHCLGNLAGAMQLKQKGYYDMEDVNGMITYFHRVLKEVAIRIC